MSQPLGRLAPGDALDVHGAIDPANDEDFFTFTIQSPVLGNFWTYEILGSSESCPTDDTEMWLYDGLPSSLTAVMRSQDHTIVAFDDDQGPGFCAQIGGMSGRGGGGIALIPGRYYLRVRRYAHEAIIPSYFLRIELRSP
jgi:hypothetical protein